MKALTALALLALTLNACTPAQKLANAQRRLNRLIDNHPQLAEAQVRDTVLTTVDHDTIFLPGSSIDTFFSFHTDTFTVTDSGVTVTITKQVDRWRVQTVVKADTIYYSDTVRIAYRDSINVFKVEPVSTAEVWRYRKQGALWLFILLVILYLAQLAIRLYLKGQLPFMKL